MINSVFIINGSGEVIIEKHYRGNTRRGECEVFWSEVLKQQSADDLPPVITTASGVLLHIYQSGLYFVASVRRDVMPMVVVEFLRRVADIFVDYFGELNEHAIKDHFIIVYELLDEMLDNGFPLTMEPNILKEMIYPPSMFSKVMETVTGESSKKAELPRSSLTNVPWRSRDVKYSQHEVFVDVVEEVDALVEADRGVIDMQITGSIMCNCKVSGMPDLTVTLNRVQDEFDNVALHHCVRLLRYEKDGVLSFVPPDGAFTLMKYVVRKTYELPLEVRTNTEFNEAAKTCTVVCTVTPRYYTSQVGQNAELDECVVSVYFPHEVSGCSVSSNLGTPHYDASQRVCKWAVGKIQKARSATLTAKITTDSNKPFTTTKPPVLVQCKLASFSITGLLVESCTVQGSASQPFRGLRCTTRARRLEFTG